MKAKDYYPTYIPRKWIHFAEHGRKYRIRKKYRNRILQTVSSHPSDFETVLFNVMQHSSSHCLVNVFAYNNNAVLFGELVAVAELSLDRLLTLAAAGISCINDRP